MSGEMIAIVAVGVALAGVILTSLRGTEGRSATMAPAAFRRGSGRWLPFAEALADLPGRRVVQPRNTIFALGR